MNNVMPAGTYYVGDLCYVMHDAWTECCELFFENRDDHGCNEGVFKLNDGRVFANFNTAYGDGEYHSNIASSFCVDSGSIGCIKLEDINDDTYSIDNISKLGAIHTFENDFIVSEHNGIISFGDVNIYTNDNPYYEEEDEYYDDEDR
nr:MAG: hypothetical protein [Caudoviricetes sp.]